MNGKKTSRVTLQQVADHAGVSKSTASLTLRGHPRIPAKTREKVLASMKSLGYVYDRVAANLRSQSSSTIGLIISEISNPFFSELVEGVQQTLDKQGYTVLLGATGDSPTKQETLLFMMLEYRVGGVIVSPVSGSSHENLDQLKQWGIPMVIATREPLQMTNYDFVGVDNIAGSKMAVEYLIANGHRRIALLGGSPQISTWRDRKQGYLDALTQAGIEIDESLVMEGPITRKGGIEIVERILRHPIPPTAALCFNDVVALGVMKGLKAAGMQPGPDFSVIGFDNISESAVHSPELTTVSTFPDKMGKHAAELLHQRIVGMVEPPKRIILKPELVVRESCSSLRL
ncbi:LacI family DNA-binding transcriptional regulator [Brevibacillus sp. TJ4]|uniref:LacI family DNA-binding transcriptional regulator n=1 Tax=Brevibacillus sp. TJ4 TaxID=3234853 RepID=UPI0037D58164